MAVVEGDGDDVEAIMREILHTQFCVDISELLGKTITSIDLGSDVIMFHCGDVAYKMYHAQDCCESVWLEDVCGEWVDLIGSPILMAEETSNEARTEENDSCTWTFYKLATTKGYVTLRWCGTSNGYYSEGVDVDRIEYGPEVQP